MNIDRRQLALPVACHRSPLGSGPRFGGRGRRRRRQERRGLPRGPGRRRRQDTGRDYAPRSSATAIPTDRVEDKATFVANATDGKSKVISLAYQDVKIRVVGPAAIVRFHWVGESESVADGKKSSTNLHILMNWQKQGNDWKLLSRAKLRSTKLCHRWKRL
jgi:hypothetical protein